MEKPAYLFDKSLIFRQIPLFANLNFFEKKLILDSLEILEFKKSQLIYRQGDPPDAFYCLITGRVDIFIEKDRKEERLEYIHRGKYFGFISLLTGEPHSVSARAATDTLIAKIPGDDFNIILKNIPSLAISLSQMLSRRLKRKDLHPKSIFESTIIVIYGDEPIHVETSLYALNLALGLNKQTQKKVILVDAGLEDATICEALKIDSKSGFMASQPLFNIEEVIKKIVKHSSGIDLLRLLCDDQHPLTAAFLVSLTTMLVNDYHYCVVPLSSKFGSEALKILIQSDALHFLVPSDISSLQKTTEILRNLGILADTELKKKTKLVMIEKQEIYAQGSKLSYEQKIALIQQPIFATVPPMEEKETFLITDDFKTPYSKVIRRISRQIGEVLVGLALGSGSAMGMAHIGVLKVLEREGIPIDIVCGSSIGALVGALWCCGYCASEVEEIILKNMNKRYLFGWDDLVFPLHGLIKGKHIYRFLKTYLKDKTFYSVVRPFKIVACDCLSMKQVVFDSGRLIDAVMASISIPGVFEPYKIQDRYYIDGGILNPLPTDVLVEAGAKKIISVNVLPSSDEIERTYELLSGRKTGIGQKWVFLNKAMALTKKRFREFLKPNIFDVIVSSVQSIEFMLAHLSSLSQSDVSLHPDMTAVSWAAFDNAAQLIKRGEEEASLHLKEIKELVTSSD